MDRAKLTVLFSADETYMPHLATAIESLLTNNADLVNEIFVLTEFSDSERFRLLQASVAERHKVRVSGLGADMDRVANMQVTGHISLAAYFRFLSADLLPASVADVLYLDCDLVVAGRLDELVDSIPVLHRPRPSEPLGYGVAAIRRDESVHLKRFGFKSDEYFNSGVMLINLVYWREYKLSERLLRRATELHGRLDLWDQDVLNLEFEDNWLELPGRFNVTTVDDLDDDAVIIHFAGSTKPWMVGNKHPKAELYRHYRSLTPFYPYKREQLGRYLYRRLVPKVFRDWKKTKRRTKRSINRFLRRLKQSLR